MCMGQGPNSASRFHCASGLKWLHYALLVGNNVPLMYLPSAMHVEQLLYDQTFVMTIALSNQKHKYALSMLLCMPGVLHHVLDGI